jgi:hypothetical protein
MLSFTVSGPTGTHGYANITIGKTLVTSLTNLKIYIDGKQANCQISSTDNYWLLLLDYHHSTSTIVVSLDSAQSATAFSSQTNASNSYQPEIFLSVTSILIAIVASMLFRRKAIRR